MNRPELFVQSVDILVDAYNRGQLKNMQPCHCAVGNLIAYKRGNYEFTDKWVDHLFIQRHLDTKDDFLLSLAARARMSEMIRNGEIQKAEEEISSLEYTWEEIEQIEGAFENIDQTTKRRKATRNDDPIHGLIRAVKVLGKIHNIPEETVSCIQIKILDKTYKFAHEFEDSHLLSKDGPNTGPCPIIKPLNAE